MLLHIFTVIDPKRPHIAKSVSRESIRRIAQSFQQNILVKMCQRRIFVIIIYTNQRIRTASRVFGIFSGVNKYAFCNRFLSFYATFVVTALRVYSRCLFGYTLKTRTGPTWVAYPRKPGSLFVLVVSGRLLIYQMCKSPISRSATPPDAFFFHILIDPKKIKTATSFVSPQSEFSFFSADLRPPSRVRHHVVVFWFVMVWRCSDKHLHHHRRSLRQADLGDSSSVKRTVVAFDVIHPKTTGVCKFDVRRLF